MEAYIQKKIRICERNGYIRIPNFSLYNLLKKPTELIFPTDDSQWVTVCQKKRIYYLR